LLKTVSIFFEILNEGWISHLLQIFNTQFTGSTGVSSQGNLCDGSGVQISHDATFFEVLNFLGISNIFVKVFVIVENCLYIF